jgi:hypothetical protein
MSHGADIGDDVCDLARGGSACVLRPCAFFVAWNGVLTIVYSGFPPPLEKLKQSLSALPRFTRPENFGSRWPKSTLGAWTDEAEPLALDELRRLQELCRTHSARLAESSLLVPVGQLSAVTCATHTFEPMRASWAHSAVPHAADAARALERTVERRELPLQPAGTDADAASPSAAEQERVQGVLREWDDLPAYLPAVNKPGSRIGSYREASPAGATLVAFLADAAPPALHTLLDAFRAGVDELLPGRYVWLEPRSLHCTVRSLDA